MVSDERIEALARRLGEAAAARVDPYQVAQGVLARLRRETVVRPVWQRAIALRVAAALVLVASAGLVVRHLVPPAPMRDTAAVVPLTLEELEAFELAQVLDSLAVEAPIAESTPATLADLSEAELRELLEALEG